MKCYTLKTIILGDCGVGKTSLLYKYYNGNFNHETESTVGVNFVSKYIENNHYDDVIKLQIWDTAGQERFRSIIRSYYNNVCGCIIVYDITNRNSFENCAYWIEEVCRNNSEVKLILIGTKKDLEQNRTVDYEEGIKLSNYHNIPFFEVSAKDCVCDMFEHLVKRIMTKVSDNNTNIDSMKGVVYYDNFEMYAHQKKRNELSGSLRETCCYS